MNVIGYLIKVLVFMDRHHVFPLHNQSPLCFFHDDNASCLIALKPLIWTPLAYSITDVRISPAWVPKRDASRKRHAGELHNNKALWWHESSEIHEENWCTTCTHVCMMYLPALHFVCTCIISRVDSLKHHIAHQWIIFVPKNLSQILVLKFAGIRVSYLNCIYKGSITMNHMDEQKCLHQQKHDQNQQWKHNSNHVDVLSVPCTSKELPSNLPQDWKIYWMEMISGNL